MIYSSEVTFTDELISEISGNSSTSAGSIDILQAVGKTVTQGCEKDCGINCRSRYNW
ncbi:protein of unknown function [Streptococcus thermophilus]|nr:protein of unknown function [Streptococcus thermophilus]CAD0191876.1 protein of unknown function [Streptococcus thermophilus]